MKRDSILATCMVTFTVAFLWPIYTHLGTLTQWQPIGPKDMQALVLAMMMGIAAVGCALGIDIGALFKNILGVFGLKKE